MNLFESNKNLIFFIFSVFTVTQRTAEWNKQNCWLLKEILIIWDFIKSLNKKKD